MLMRIMSLEGGRVIKGDCHVLIALFRHCGGKFTVMTCVCGDPMDLAINMVIGSDDCSIGDQAGSKRSRRWLKLLANHISPPLSCDQHRQKHQRRARSFFTIPVFLWSSYHIGRDWLVGQWAIHYVYSPSIAWSECWARILLHCTCSISLKECVISILFNLDILLSPIWHSKMGAGVTQCARLWILYSIVFIWFSLNKVFAGIAAVKEQYFIQYCVSIFEREYCICVFANTISASSVTSGIITLGSITSRGVLHRGVLPWCKAGEKPGDGNGDPARLFENQFLLSCCAGEPRRSAGPAGGPSQLSQSRGDQRAESTSFQLAPPSKKISKQKKVKF